MSCIYCLNKDKQTEDQHPCLCDQFIHPLPVHIDAGLDKLPRQIATFHEYRRAMLRTIQGEEIEIIDKNNLLVKLKPLSNWRARDKDDLGIMLLEMWAYLCDSLSFYDEVLANESYIRTSALRPSLRKLVALLGYLPRPAVSSVVELAAIADGRIPLVLPAGTAFSSGAFDGNPAQVFELNDDVVIHPFLNRMGIIAPHGGKITTDNPSSLLVNLIGEIKEENLLLLINKADDTQNSNVRVKQLEKYNGIDGTQYNKLSFTSPTRLMKGASLTDLQLLKPTVTARLWTVSETTDSINATKITLNVLTQQINPGDLILLSSHTEYRWFKILNIAEVPRYMVPPREITINTTSFTTQGIAISVTQLILDLPVNDNLRKSSGGLIWDESICSEITIYFGMQRIADITDEPNVTITGSDALAFDELVESPDEKYRSHQFLLEDKNTVGVSIGGNILYDENRLSLDQVTTWKTPLTLPVNIYGNVITASRGETVENEKMGSGDASIANQTFKLKKKPLSYYQSATLNNDSAVKNTLSVYINGIRWTEVNSFFGQTENDEVYIVRQNDEGESQITFGDGIRGRRIPTGTDNIICNYKFGAEAACPPAGSVSQVTTPITGLQSVNNILPAFGGADAESEEKLRVFAPKSALLLGRAVSMKDMEAIASAHPGVRAVQTEWRWDKNKQRASAHIFYIGDESLRSIISQRIRSVSDPATPITVEKAESNPLFISLNIQIDPRYLEQDVLRELRQILLNAEHGLLAPENIGIGLPLYRSRIFEAILNVKGTEAVLSILINNDNFEDFAKVPGAGHYFDIEQGKLIINGKEN